MIVLFLLLLLLCLPLVACSDSHPAHPAPVAPPATQSSLPISCAMLRLLLLPSGQQTVSCRPLVIFVAIAQGAAANEMFFISSGSADVFIEQPDGDCTANPEVKLKHRVDNLPCCTILYNSEGVNADATAAHHVTLTGRHRVVQWYSRVDCCVLSASLSIADDAAVKIPPVATLKSGTCFGEAAHSHRRH